MAIGTTKRKTGLTATPEEIAGWNIPPLFSPVNRARMDRLYELLKRAVAKSDVKNEETTETEVKVRGGQKLERSG